MLRIVVCWIPPGIVVYLCIRSRILVRKVSDDQVLNQAMADAIVYATAQDQEVEVVTGDADLKGLSGGVYVK